MQNTSYIDIPICVCTQYGILWILSVFIAMYSTYHLSSCFSIFLAIFYPLHPILLSLFPRLRQWCYVSAGFSESDLAIDC